MGNYLCKIVFLVSRESVKGVDGFHLSVKDTIFRNDGKGFINFTNILNCFIVLLVIFVIDGKTDFINYFFIYF